MVKNQKITLRKCEIRKMFGATLVVYIDKKRKIKFSSYIRTFRWERLQLAKSYIYKEGFLYIIYEEMRKYLVIYEKAVSPHI
jgi:hypothetical protein